MGTLTARETVRNCLVGKATNEKIIRYGKINKHLAYEITVNNGQYLDYTKYNISFVKYNQFTKTLKSQSHLDLCDQELTEIESYVKQLKKERVCM